MENGRSVEGTCVLRLLVEMQVNCTLNLRISV